MVAAGGESSAEVSRRGVDRGGGEIGRGVGVRGRDDAESSGLGASAGGDFPVLGLTSDACQGVREGTAVDIV